MMNAMILSAILMMPAAAQQSGSEESDQALRTMREERLRRLDPNNQDVEVVAGEAMPYSLPRRIAQYKAEAQARAKEMNALAAEINGLTARIEKDSSGKHAFPEASRLPADIKPEDADSSKKVDAAIVTAADLAVRLEKIAVNLSEMPQVTVDAGVAMHRLVTGRGPELSFDAAAGRFRFAQKAVGMAESELNPQADSKTREILKELQKLQEETASKDLERRRKHDADREQFRKDMKRLTETIDRILKQKEELEKFDKR